MKAVLCCPSCGANLFKTGVYVERSVRLIPQSSSFFQLTTESILDPLHPNFHCSVCHFCEEDRRHLDWDETLIKSWNLNHHLSFYSFQSLAGKFVQDSDLKTLFSSFSPKPGVNETWIREYEIHFTFNDSSKSFIPKYAHPILWPGADFTLSTFVQIERENDSNVEEIQIPIETLPYYPISTNLTA